MPTQSLGTHQGNAVFSYGIVSGCVVAPNKPVSRSVGLLLVANDTQGFAALRDDALSLWIETGRTMKVDVTDFDPSISSLQLNIRLQIGGDVDPNGTLWVQAHANADLDQYGLSSGLKKRVSHDAIVDAAREAGWKGPVETLGCNNRKDTTTFYSTANRIRDAVTPDSGYRYEFLRWHQERYPKPWTPVYRTTLSPWTPQLRYIPTPVEGAK